MKHPSQISITEFSYHLPDEKIALHPLEQRDASRLLVYKDGIISETVFAKIADRLPPYSLLVFNDSRVINARIRFKKSSGGAIEIFCLEPLGSITEYATVMNATGNSTWKCMVGGASKWKNETLEKKIIIDGEEATLFANLKSKMPDAYEVELSWLPATLSLASVIEAAGDTPLPPYIKRDTELEDVNRYQTIFAKQEGSVAAPTAGLHFTKNVFESFNERNIQACFVSLHVGAGTFKPVKAAQMQDHEMHAEYISIRQSAIEELLANIGKIAAVGTTSLRTIESIYWFGVKSYLRPDMHMPELKQWDAYDEVLQSEKLPASAALEALLLWMKKKGISQIFTKTQLLIAPGYRFRLANILVTNFHQPQSTLLLIVAAAIGDDWKKMYDYALKNDFRFLSYGDGNLIFINEHS
jgi:S-adenosylmethionine:tRNA ribosyltransferase-isomerase